MLENALSTIDDYVNFFSASELPVLKHTAHEIEAARDKMDRITARDLASIIFHDPFMAVKVLNYIQPFHGKRLRHDITTIGGAVTMLGVEPFFNHFDELITLEDRLSGHPHALLGVLKTIRRSLQASRWAHDWAVLRYDINVEEVALAALLDNLAELLMWCHAPLLALKVQQRQHDHPNTRSHELEREIYGFRLLDLQLGLCRAWHLPELLQRLMDADQDQSPRVRNVQLAINLARHVAHGWGDPAIPDDLHDISQLTHLSISKLIAHLHVPEEAIPPLLASASEATEARAH